MGDAANHADAGKLHALDGAGAALRIRGLKKAFGDVQAVDGIDLEVAQGRVLWVAGAEWGGEDDDH